jgi:hypothetical protein
MARKMKLSTKLACGFGVMIFIAAAMAVTGWRGITHLVASAELSQAANTLLTESLTGRISEKNFMLRREVKHQEDATQMVQRFHKLVAATLDSVDGTEERDALARCDKQIDAWKAS